ncbi:replication initiation protein [Pseudomonas oryzihabitans]|uniref:replication initiation protein n=1 Tax=Pseudomonas oryzihabitans TaxID=47885 RepID=UPI0039927E86
MFEEAAYLTRCSDNKTAMRVRPREFAFHYPYVQVNRPGRVSWLVFDLDHPDSLIWESQGLPPPNLIVRNRKSGSSHLFYAIVPVCTTENARQKPIDYLKAVYRAYATILKADPDYHGGPVAKTPGHSWWSTAELHSSVYELGELAEAVAINDAPAWAKRPNVEAVSHSRHCSLFEMVRFFAYSLVNEERQSGCFESFHQRVLAKAFNESQRIARALSPALPYSSIKATAKSIARWTWSRYQGSSTCHRGAMRLSPDLPLKEKQAQAARYTHNQRTQATASKIRAACRGLVQLGKPLTLSAIASVSSLTRQTVAKYQHVVAEDHHAPVAPIGAGDPRGPDVNFALHQIPAASFFNGPGNVTLSCDDQGSAVASASGGDPAPAAASAPGDDPDPTVASAPGDDPDPAVASAPGDDPDPAVASVSGDAPGSAVAPGPCDGADPIHCLRPTGPAKFS